MSTLWSNMDPGEHADELLAEGGLDAIGVLSAPLPPWLLLVLVKVSTSRIRLEDRLGLEEGLLRLEVNTKPAILTRRAQLCSGSKWFVVLGRPFSSVSVFS